MLEQAGASRIVAVEANARCYLRCLTVKELLHLKRAEFLLGDAVAYLREAEEFDVAVACGILYHLVEPVELIAVLAARCERVFLWTHYFDAERLEIAVSAPRFARAHSSEIAGFECELHTQRYPSSPFSSFFGGSAATSCWLTREGLFAALNHFGFRTTAVGFDEPDNPSGPSIAIVASR